MVVMMVLVVGPRGSAENRTRSLQYKICFMRQPVTVSYSCGIMLGTVSNGCSGH